MGEPKPVLVSGATGLIGQRLRAALGRDGIPVRALTRDPETARGRLGTAVEVVGWDGRSATPDHARDCRAIVHLAGEPVFAGPLTSARRERILDSRVSTTRSFVETLAALPDAQRPAVFACASAVGFYGSRGDELLDETSTAGEGFLADVCQQWEAAAREAADLGVRVVMLRFGIVMAREGGALALMARVFRLGIGGKLGSGEQWVPWVHVDDAVGLLRAALEDDRYQGPVNVVAPEPVRNAELTSELARVLRRPAFLPAPAFVLRAALGELSAELLGSRRVRPGAALAHGYRFAHSSLASALEVELG